MMDGPFVFVFGSNLAGRHGKGAALYAKKIWGAEHGVGKGPTGRAYALPTKDAKLHPLSMLDIANHVADFAEYARNTPDKIFLLTPVGCGLAGHPVSSIAALLQRWNLPFNVVLSQSWLEHFNTEPSMP